MDTHASRLERIILLEELIAKLEAYKPTAAEGFNHRALLLKYRNQLYVTRYRAGIKGKPRIGAREQARQERIRALTAANKLEPEKVESEEVTLEEIVSEYASPVSGEPVIKSGMLRALLESLPTADKESYREMMERIKREQSNEQSNPNEKGGS